MSWIVPRSNVLIAERSATIARLDALILYTHYVERWFDYSNATGPARQAAFERLIRHAYRMRRTMMIHTLGLYRLHLSDGGDGTEITWPAGTPLTIRSDPASPALLHGRWTLYFYVPRNTKVIGGFADGPGELRDPDGKTVHTFGDAPGYFSIPVPAGQDAKLWRFHHGNGRRLLMTVPPYLARSAKELLLPREVVERGE